MKALEEIQCRVVVIGDSSVGKTSILNRIVQSPFNPYELSTVGANYQVINREENGQKLEIHIWDTAGQEKFRSLSPIYFRNSIGAIAVYDQSNKSSYENLEMWINMFTEIAGTESIIVVAANKCDLVNNCEISLEEATKWCHANNFEIFQTSASNGLGIDELFDHLVKELYRVINTKRLTSDHVNINRKESGCGC
ncbi:small GTP-binding protein, putative [Trichomonas vaginalis G3]|uniref:Small GTP-binding protein, putative n=1 Tax=Trichomonas vaginalis (strain ATCC PRA-98 / G3) TaxID=412133 RepID=A2FJT3_TRIV3|nr:GTPase protein [Trichomonas vaginalis G3]EAX94824.1 small GTP-binding protein, putative [Trichomonas vaginalis G3]KAI5532164.1 GTPase protein [Trichomonas vaginalis G3]|eukprot:XP_001307754.1 small GTP-binding protein [Trichomonas vaginalis G3]